MKLLQGITFVAYLSLALCVGVVVYRVHQQIEKVERWVEAIDATLANHATIIHKQADAVHRLIDRLKPGESSAPSSLPQQEGELFDSGKPTVVLYSIEGCGPCEQWWRDQAPQWIANGWIVKRKHSATSRPTPYWVVYDGEKLIEFDRTLTLEKYRIAGGRE